MTCQRWVVIDLPWLALSPSGMPRRLAVDYTGDPWDIPVTLGPAVRYLAGLHGVCLRPSQVERMVHSIRIVERLDNLGRSLEDDDAMAT